MKSQGWIYAAAGYNVALAVFHLGFWRLFRWREELPKLRPVNRGVMQVMNIMLTFLFLSMAALLAGRAEEVAGTSLGRALLIASTGFWLLRAMLQPLFWASLPGTTNLAFASLFLVGAGLHYLALRSA